MSLSRSAAFLSLAVVTSAVLIPSSSRAGLFGSSKPAAVTSIPADPVDFAAIKAEWERTDQALSLITGEATRLESNPALARSIEHRFPYIDPLHHLQVELIRRYREGKADERVQRGIHISINGIAAGLRNTG